MKGKEVAFRGRIPFPGKIMDGGGRHKSRFINAVPPASIPRTEQTNGMDAGSDVESLEV